jgi:hypothetical protein
LGPQVLINESWYYVAAKQKTSMMLCAPTSTAVTSFEAVFQNLLSISTDIQRKASEAIFRMFINTYYLRLNLFGTQITGRSFAIDGGSLESLAALFVPRYNRLPK